MNITVVTPWLNCPELRDGYWQAIDAGLAPDDRVVIVDNGSSPPVEAPTDSLIRLDSNQGFAAACNIGLERANTDAVLFLNNDVRLRDRRWLEMIRQELRPGVLVGPDLRITRHTAVDGRIVPYLDGWCLAGLTEELRELGGFNEDFEEPSYYGDNELCVRARAHGMKLVQCDAGLRHLGNYTSRHTDVSAVSERNRARYEAAVRYWRPITA